MKSEHLRRSTLVGVSCMLLPWAALLFSCGKVPESNYYTLSLPLVTAKQQNNGNSVPAVPVVIGMSKLESGFLYREDRIIYRESPYEVKYWNYRKWVAPPYVMITEYLREYLKNQHIFADVVPHPSPRRVKYVLSGRVLAFEEWDEGANWFGKVGFELTVTNTHTNQMLWQKSYERMLPVREKLPASVVAALSEGLHQCFQEVARDLRGELQGRLSD